MDSAAAPPEPLLVACLCAAWCQVCESYRATFEALALEFAASARFVWIDIEDDEDALGPVEVDDFPTLLIAQGEQVRHFAAVVPNARTAQRLLQRALQGQLGLLDDHRLAALPDRLRTLQAARDGGGAR